MSLCYGQANGVYSDPKTVSEGDQPPKKLNFLNFLGPRQIPPSPLSTQSWVSGVSMFLSLSTPCASTLHRVGGGVNVHWAQAAQEVKFLGGWIYFLKFFLRHFACVEHNGSGGVSCV